MGPGFFGDQIEVPGCGVVVVVRQAVGVGEMGALAAQRLGLVVHFLHKGVD